MVDTPAGPKLVHSMRSGDQIWGSRNGVKVATTVTKVYSKRTLLKALPGRQVAETLLVTDNHILFEDGDQYQAGSMELPAVPVSGPVYDLATETGNYFASGRLLRAAD